MSSTQRFLDDSEVYEIAFDGIDGILDSVIKVIGEKWAQSLVPQLATDMAMVKISKLFAWSMIAYDGHESASDQLSTSEGATLNGGSTKLDDESEPVGNEVEKTPSISSQHSGVTGKTSNSKHHNITKGVKKGGAYLEEECDPTGQIIELDDPDLEFADLNNADLFQQLNKVKRLKSSGDVLTSQEKSEFELLQEDINKQLAEMKIKKYAIDATGKVIPLQPVKPDSLPAYSVALDTKINSPRAATGSKGSNRPKGAVAEGGDKRKKKVIRVAGSRTIEDDDYFVPSNTLATVLSLGENIGPQAGVALKVGNNTREGPTLPDDPLKLSRKQYLSRSINPSIGDSMSRAQTGGGSPSMDLDGSMSLGVGFGDSYASPVAGGLPQSMHSVRFPDIDALEGGRRILSSEELKATETNPTDEELGLGPKNTSGQTNAGVLPRKKDTSLQLFDFDTTKTGLPKDRDLPINQRHPSERKHQLAPPPGRVSIRQKDDKVSAGPGSPNGSVASGHSGSASPSKQGMSASKVSLVKGPENKSGFIKPVRPELARAIF